MSRHLNQHLAAGALGAGLLLAGPVPAADTLETWDAGCADVEFAVTLDGMGQDAGERAYCGDMLLGWGVARRLSAYVALSLAGSGDLRDGTPSAGLGVFGTPLETDHVDLDLHLEFGADGPGLGRINLGPSLELNLDAAPDRASWGLYARAGLALAEAADDEADATAKTGADPGATTPVDADGRTVDRLLTVGTYLTLDPKRQLLLEYDVIYHDEPEPGAPATEHGGLALGYNRLLGEQLELVSQVRWDVPQGGGDGALGMSLGVIATLPGGSAR